MKVNFWRRLHKWYAIHAGYFWTPCPRCKVPFGGHELRSWHISTSVEQSNGSFFSACSQCVTALHKKYKERAHFLDSSVWGVKLRIVGIAAKQGHVEPAYEEEVTYKKLVGGAIWTNKPPRSQKE